MSWRSELQKLLGLTIKLERAVARYRLMSNTDSRSQLERWFDTPMRAEMERKDLEQLIRVLKQERDAWRTTAHSTEKALQCQMEMKSPLLNPR